MGSSRPRLPAVLPGPHRSLPRLLAASCWITLAFLLACDGSAMAQTQTPHHLYDRGPGVATSLFGNYIQEREAQLYVFYEYYRNTDTYTPKELGYKLDKEYDGRTTRHEFLVFGAYGFTADFAVEFEAALYDSVTLRKDPDDPSKQPKAFTESGTGDTETSLRWRLWQETTARPELYGYLKIVFPLQKDKKLIGTQDWEFGPGLGIIKGFGWGTLKLAASAEYTKADGDWSPSVLLEYLKRFSPSWRGVLAVESSGDEVEGIVEAQWFFRSNAVLKMNVAAGLTEPAPDFAPEVGVLVSF